MRGAPTGLARLRLLTGRWGSSPEPAGRVRVADEPPSHRHLRPGRPPPPTPPRSRTLMTEAAEVRPTTMRTTRTMATPTGAETGGGVEKIETAAEMDVARVAGGETVATSSLARCLPR